MLNQFNKTNHNKNTYTTPHQHNLKVQPPTGYYYPAKHILLVEDQPLIQIIMQRQLQDLGYYVTLAASGEEAIKYFSSEIDLVIMDIDLPGISGIEATQQIRSLFQDCTTPIIAHSANQDPHTQQRCLDAGMAYIMDKGPTPVQLKEAIEANLNTDKTQARPNLRSQLTWTVFY